MNREDLLGYPSPFEKTLDLCKSCDTLQKPRVMEISATEKHPAAYWITCPSCGMETTTYKTPEEARSVWNRRRHEGGTGVQAAFADFAWACEKMGRTMAAMMAAIERQGNETKE